MLNVHAIASKFFCGPDILQMAALLRRTLVLQSFIQLKISNYG